MYKLILKPTLPPTSPFPFRAIPYLRATRFGTKCAKGKRGYFFGRKPYILISRNISILVSILINILIKKCKYTYKYTYISIQVIT